MRDSRRGRSRHTDDEHATLVLPEPETRPKRGVLERLHRLLAEGSLLAALGGLLGTGGGVAYAWLMMAGLRSLWLPAVGSSQLFLHVTPASLLLGWGIAVVVVLFSIAHLVVITQNFHRESSVDDDATDPPNARGES